MQNMTNQDGSPSLHSMQDISFFLDSMECFLISHMIGPTELPK